MSDFATAAGSTLWIGLPANSYEDQPGEIGSYDEVELITDMGEFGGEPDIQEYVDPETLQVRRHKGSINSGILVVVAGRLDDDAGQIRMRAAALEEMEFRFRAIIDGRSRHFIGEVLSAVFTVGSANQVLQDTYRIAVNTR